MLNEPTIDAGRQVVDMGGERDAGLPLVAVKERPKPPKLSQMVNAIMQKNQPRLRRCLESHRAELPEKEGRVVVALKFDGLGTVTEVSTDPVMPEITPCLEGVLKAISFPKGIGGFNTIVNYGVASSQ